MTEQISKASSDMYKKKPQSNLWTFVKHHENSITLFENYLLFEYKRNIRTNERGGVGIPTIST